MSPLAPPPDCAYDYRPMSESWSPPKWASTGITAGRNVYDIISALSVISTLASTVASLFDKSWLAQPVDPRKAVTDRERSQNALAWGFARLFGEYFQFSSQSLIEIIELLVAL